jgi:polar amino acid transport system substrate-binding protein
MRRLIWLAAAIALLSVMAGCASTPSTPAQTPSFSTAVTPKASSLPASSAPVSSPTVSPSASSSASVSGGGQTFGQLSTAGKTVFSSRCAKCHGDKGQGQTGPAIIGPQAGLKKYNTGQGLLGFISTTMPFEAPGSLSHQDYLNVLAYLLVQNNLVTDSATFSEGQLGAVALK